MRDSVDYSAFLKGYENELEFFASKIGERKVKTIFFGGGTPSLMPISLVAGILKKISSLWEIDQNCEISLEANPTSSESANFKALHDIGVNRLSIGIQALNDQDLKFLGREHSSAEAIKTIETAAKIFDNFSFDLIYARPEQKLTCWRDELMRALNFGTKHLSLYQLTIEKGTKFYSRFLKKEFVMPDEELSAQFYEMTSEILLDKGFEHYEISNYAKKNFESRHNLAYWQSKDYIGIGAGAHSRVYFENEKNRQAIMMTHEPSAWLKKALNEKAAIQTQENVLPQELLEEVILMGLRLKEGIKNEIFLQHFGKNISEIFDLEKLEKLDKQGVIAFDKNHIKIVEKFRILSNSIIAEVCASVVF